MIRVNPQLDSADEQAAAIRRELDGRMQKVAEMERVSHTWAEKVCEKASKLADTTCNLCLFS